MNIITSEARFRQRVIKYSFPKICLGFMTPSEALEKYLYAM